MKKRIVIISLILIVLSIVTISAVNSNKTVPLTKETIAENTPEMKKIKERLISDFIYEIAPRFTPIKKSDLDTIRSFNDIIGDKHAQRILSYQSVDIMLMINDMPSKIRIEGNDHQFNDTQLEFLKSLDYSTNLVIWADYTEKNKETGAIEVAHWTPYLTIVPEQQAQYPHGMEALKEFLIENSYEERKKADVNPKTSQPAKIYFTVTKEGRVDSIRLDRTSNYPLVDNRLMELIKLAPGQWQPAKNEQGEAVDQEYVISFGTMGC